MVELPWFIWKEIINNSLSPDNINLCFLNKDWFKFGMGRFLTINKNENSIQNNTPNWFSLAEKLNVNGRISWLDTGFFKEFSQINSITFDFNTSVSVYDFVVRNLNIQKLFSLELKFNNSDIFLHFQDLLSETKNRLRVLKLHCSEENFAFNKVFELKFPNLYHFEAKVKSGRIFFPSINQSMLNLNYLSTDCINISYDSLVTNNLVFNHLKIIKIVQCKQLNINIEITNIFNFHFPTLVSLKITGCLKNADLQKIPLCMPQLDHLDLKLESLGSLYDPFPVQPLSCLQKLTLFSDFNYRRSDFYGINLTNLPQLTSLEINQDFNFVDLNEVLKDKFLEVKFFKGYTIPEKALFFQLPIMNEFKLNCRLIGNTLETILKLCRDVSYLTLTNIDTFLPNYLLPPGPFRATHINLHGKKFLNNNLLKWLKSQFTITHLTINHQSRDTLKLNPIRLTNLKYLKLISINKKNRGILINLLAGKGISLHIK